MFGLLPGMGYKPASASSPRLDTADLEAFFDKIIEEQLDQFNIPNLTVSVVAAGGVVMVDMFLSVLIGVIHVDVKPKVESRGSRDKGTKKKKEFTHKYRILPDTDLSFHLSFQA